MALPEWPPGLTPYRRTPEFDETSLPSGLLRAHSTRAGVWGRLHVLEGLLLFRDLVSGEELSLAPGIHAVISPERPHEVEPQGRVRFLIEFCAAA